MVMPTTSRREGSMMSVGQSLFMALYLWDLVTGVAPWTVGPCDLVTTKAYFNCSGRKLTEVPGEVWANVTMLDLSQNSLNLTRPATLQALRRLEGLVLLNLSGNYLPLLDSDTLAGLRDLNVLDLSSTQLAEIKPGAFQALPKLHTLLLGNNRLRDPLPAALGDLSALSFLDLHGNDQLKAPPPAWLKGIQQIIRPRAWHGLDLGDMPRGASNFHRKLLVEDEVKNKSLKEAPSGDAPTPTHTWLYLMAALVTALSVASLILLAVKCKLFRRYLASYRHALLYEGDVASQCSRAGLGVGLPGYDRHGDGQPRPGLEEDDDDGFIEDNYIQASERERAEKEAEEGEGGEETEDDDLQFTIG
ncbi:LRR receptor-like serine/threonine-protein kinase RCH1 isoform X3 [Anguilla anguilla]|uniref:LRR receptor-like serine/threonine-protein kinase RCH1 isoform X3 n=1 Tax=Anguilla anguilla TaxID=7936 RepID=UPI0015AD0CDF|nr:LRR receptor-like serine/threonine-protein kinase RCH1 isoform X3 [Anguilla anguilla]